jgi:hypothetical protein
MLPWRVRRGVREGKGREEKEGEGQKEEEGEGIT